MSSFLLVLISFGFVVFSVVCCLWIDNCPRRESRDHQSHHHHYVFFLPIPPPLSYLRMPLTAFHHSQMTTERRPQPQPDTAASDTGTIGGFVSFAPYTYKTIVDGSINDIALDTNTGFVFSVVALLQSDPFVHDVSQWNQGTLVSKETCGVSSDQFSLAINPDGRVHLRGLGFTGVQRKTQMEGHYSQTIPLHWSGGESWDPNQHAFPLTSKSSLPINVAVHVLLRVQNNVGELYFNNVREAVAQCEHTIHKNSKTSFRVGSRHPDGTNFFPGTLSNASLFVL